MRPSFAMLNPFVTLVLLSGTLLSGCKNPCQALCVEIADFAKSECGLEFTDAEVDSCISGHAGDTLGEGEAKVCRAGRGDVAEEWTCDEIEYYFQDNIGGTSTSGGDTGD